MRVKKQIVQWLWLTAICTVCLYSQQSEPLQSQSILKIAKTVSGSSGRYIAVILFQHKVFNYAFGMMKTVAQTLQYHHFPGPVFAVMRMTRHWSDRAIVQREYSKLSVPVVLDTFGLFEELQIPLQTFPILTVWDSTGTLRYSSQIPAVLQGSIYRKLIMRLDSLPFRKTVVRSKATQTQYSDPFRKHLQALPTLVPQAQVFLQDDSTTYTGRLQRLRCAPSERFIVLGDLDQEVVRVYRAADGKEITTITTTPWLHRLLSPVPLEALDSSFHSLGLLTHFADFGTFYPTTNTLIAHHFYTVIDSVLIQRNSNKQRLDTNIRLGKRYVLVRYTPPYDSIHHWVKLDAPDTPGYLSIQSFIPTISPWETALFPVDNWVQRNSLSVVGLDAPTDPASAEFEAHDPLLWEFSLRSGKFVRSYGDLSYNRSLLRIGYWNSHPAVDCDASDCAYLNYYHDTLYFIRSQTAYPIAAYYTSAVLYPQQNQENPILQIEPKQRKAMVNSLSPLHPVDLTVADSLVSIVWYHFGTGEIVWQIYHRMPFRLLREYRLPPSPLAAHSVLPMPQIKVSKQMNLYLVDQSTRKTLLLIYSYPKERKSTG